MHSHMKGLKSSWRPINHHPTLVPTVIRPHSRCPRAVTHIDSAVLGISIENVAYTQGVYQVSGVLISPASPDTVYSLLRDYSALPTVFRNVTSCRVSSTDEGTTVAQTCTWEFLGGVFKGSFVTELEVEEHLDTRQLSFSLIDSSFMKDFVGSWKVRSIPQGSCVHHSLSVRPSISPPQAVGDLTKKIFVSQVTGILSDLEQELILRVSSK